MLKSDHDLESTSDFSQQGALHPGALHWNEQSIGRPRFAGSPACLPKPKCPGEIEPTSLNCSDRASRSRFFDQHCISSWVRSKIAEKAPTRRCHVSGTGCVEGGLGRIDDGREKVFQAGREKAFDSFFVLKNPTVAGSRIHHQIIARPYIPASTGRRPGALVGGGRRRKSRLKPRNVELHHAHHCLHHGHALGSGALIGELLHAGGGDLPTDAKPVFDPAASHGFPADTQVIPKMVDFGLGLADDRKREGRAGRGGSGRTHERVGGGPEPDFDQEAFKIPGGKVTNGQDFGIFEQGDIKPRRQLGLTGLEPEKRVDGRMRHGDHSTRGGLPRQFDPVSSQSMTPRELRAAWDAAADTLTPEMTARGFSRRGRGWHRRDAGTGRAIGFNVERTLLASGIRVSVYNEAFAPREMRDGFGRTTGVMVDLRTPAWKLVLQSPAEIPGAVSALRDYIFEAALPEMESVLESDVAGLDGVRIGHLKEMGDPS